MLIWTEMGTFAGEYSRMDATNSPRLSAKTSATAATSAGAISGVTTCTKQYHGDPPSVRPASISDASKGSIAAVAIRVSSGTLRTKYASGTIHTVPYSG